MSAFSGTPLGTEHFLIRLLGDPVLRQHAAPVTQFDTSLENLVRKMSRTLLDGRVGVGLAAPQVGVSLRVVVYATDYAPGPGVLINPEIVEASGLDDLSGEACLSFPGHYYKVPRPDFVRLKTRTLSGDEIILSGSGTLARLCQHEVDHLNGTLIVDHVPKRLRIKSERRFRDWLETRTGSPNTTSVPMSEVNSLFQMGGYEVTGW